MSRIDLGGRTVVHLSTGAVFATDKPVAIRTLLGSCVSACLHDPIAKVGGINHFVLPSQPGDSGTRYGFEAMEYLIEECVRLGAMRSRLEAKVFGGGHMIGVPSENSVSSRNVAFIRKFLEAALMPIIAEDLGGTGGREVYFLPDNGRTFVRRIAASIAGGLHSRDEAGLGNAAFRELRDRRAS